MTQGSCIKKHVKLRINKIIAHLNRMSAKSYGRKINETIGHDDNRLGTNRETTTDVSTGKQKYKCARRKPNECNELFQSFPNEELWNSMCAKNDVSNLQVFDENENDESSVP